LSPTAQGLSYGAIAGIVVAAAVAAGLLIFGSKKGYDYFQTKVKQQFDVADCRRESKSAVLPRIPCIKVLNKEEKILCTMILKHSQKNYKLFAQFQCFL
jgi:hypothetical protein